MKTQNLFIKIALCSLLLFGHKISEAQSKDKPLAAVLGIDSKGIINDSKAVAYMVGLELDKTNKFVLMDKYDVAELVKKNEIQLEGCFGKSCVLNAGKALGVDKVITGSVERFGEKIVISLKVLDIVSETVESQNATEYQNLQPELQRMIAISVQKLVGITPDQNIVNLLVNYEAPIASPQTQMKLSGPRMGASMAFGDAAKVLQAPTREGGFNMYPTNFQIGWQFEKQYISAGDFQALVEFFPMIGGLESGKFIPSATFLNGFRMGKAGWEFAFGPSFRIVRKADGFFDTDNVLGEGVNAWHLEEDWTKTEKNPYEIQNRLDNRGFATLSTSLFIGVGRTFKSGYLNIPVNVYVLPKKEGWVTGFSFGFNIYKKPKSL